MDWDLCKTFVAVAEARSFAAAARQLRSSHPTVGRKIAALEDQLGIPLFARSHEGLSLTSQGRQFSEHVEAMAAAEGIPFRAVLTAPDLGFPFEGA